MPSYKAFRVSAKYKQKSQYQFYKIQKRFNLKNLSQLWLFNTLSY